MENRRVVRLDLNEKETLRVYRALGVPASETLTAEIVVAAAENLALKAAGRGGEGNPLSVVIARRAAAIEAQRKAGLGR